MKWRVNSPAPSASRVSRTCIARSAWSPSRASLTRCRAWAGLHLDDVVASFGKTGLAELRAIHRDLVAQARTAGEPPPDDAALNRLEGELKSAELARLVQEGHVGMAKRLTALAEGAFGDLLRRDDTLDLAAAMTRQSLTYVGLPSLARPTDVALLAKVFLQELKITAYARLQQTQRVPVLLILDEVPALGEPTQLIDLMLQSREAPSPRLPAASFSRWTRHFKQR